MSSIFHNNCKKKKGKKKEEKKEKKRRRIVKLITKKLVLFKSSISVIVVLYPFIATVNKAFSVQVLIHCKISTLTTQTLIFLFVFLSSY